MPRKQEHGKAAPYRTGELALTRGEYQKLLAACGTQQDRVLIMMAVALGLRRSDLVRVRWSDIDFERSELHYREKKKGDRLRTVPIGPKLRQELMILRASTPRNQATVFSFGDRQAHTRFNRVCDLAGIDRRPIHALRATAIKFMQAAGWTPEQVAEMTGDTIRTIQEHYLTPSRSELAEAAREREVV